MHWWRRGESNPRPKTLYSGLLRAFPVVWVSSSRTPAGRVPFGPSRFGFRPSSPREGDSGYPVRATPFRLHGQSAVGRTRLVRPRKRSYSRWRLLVPAFNEVRGASARNPGASTSPSKPFRPLHLTISFSVGWRNPARRGATRGRGTSPCPWWRARCRASRPGRRCPPACRTASCRGPARSQASRAVPSGRAAGG